MATGGSAGGGSERLAHLFVEFSAKGAEGLDALFAKQKNQLQAINEAAGKSSILLQKLTRDYLAIQHAQEEFNKAARWEMLVQQQGKFQAALTVTKEKMENVAKAGRWMFAGGVGLIVGTAATAGNVAIDTLTGSFKLLSGEVGIAFIPIVLKVSEYVQRLAGWIRNLSGENKENFARWVIWGTAIGGVLILLPKVVSGIQAVTLTIKALDAAIVATGWGALIKALGLVAAALMTTASGRSALGELVKTLSSLVEVLGKLLGIVTRVIGFVANVIAGVVNTSINVIRSLPKVFTAPFSEPGSAWVHQRDTRPANIQIEEFARSQREFPSLLRRMFPGIENQFRREQGLALAGRQGTIGFTALDEAWRRIQVQALQGDLERERMDLARRGNEAAERTAANTDAMRARMDNWMGLNNR